MTASVLIVDGDEAFAVAAQSALEAQGLTVFVREDATIDLVRKLRPSVLMLSVEMKSGSGFSMCSRIRRDKDLKTTPIFLTSSEASSEGAFKRHAETADRADAYALKPFDTATLLDRVGRLVVEAQKRNVGNGDAAVAAAPSAAEKPPEAPPKRGPSKVGPPPSPPPRNKTRGGDGGEPPPPPTPPRRAEPIASSPLDATAPGEPMPSSGSGGGGDGWHAQSFEDALRERGELVAPAAPSNASPDQRLEFLRHRAKYLEAREKAAKDAWDAVQGQGRESERRSAALRLERDKRDARIAELTAELEKTAAQLRAVETEFATFQEEITRIFKEKDSEERQTLGRVQNLEEANSGLEKDLADALQRIDDDQRRLGIFQEEVESVQQANDEGEKKIAELEEQLSATRAALDQAQDSITELRSRLETTETIATDRAGEIDALHEKIDNIAIEATLDKQRLEDAHAQTVAGLSEEHGQIRADLERTLSTTISKHSDLQRELHNTRLELSKAEGAIGELQGELDSLTVQRDGVQNELDKSREVFGDKRVEYEQALEEQQLRGAELESQVSGSLERIAELEADLDRLMAELAAEKAEHQRTLEAHRRTAEILEAETSTQGQRIEELVLEKDTLALELESERQQRSEVEDESKRTTVTLDAELADKANRIAELESLRETLESEQLELSTQSNAQAERLQALETELDEIRTQLFDRMAELDQARTEREDVEQRVAELEQGNARIGELEEQTTALRQENDDYTQRLLDLEAQKDALEQAEREASQALNAERDKNDRAESFIKKAKEKIVELQRSGAESLSAAQRDNQERVAAAQKELEERMALAERHASDRLAEEKKKREELESKLAKTESELSMREMEAAESGRERANLDRKLHDATKEQHQSTEAQQKEHERIEAELRTARAELEQLKKENRELPLLRAERKGSAERLSNLEAKNRELDQRLLVALDGANEGQRRGELIGRIGAALQVATDLLFDESGGPAKGGAAPPSSTPPKSRPAEPSRRAQRAAPARLETTPGGAIFEDTRRIPEPPSDGEAPNPRRAREPFEKLIDEIGEVGRSQQVTATRAAQEPESPFGPPMPGSAPIDAPTAELPPTRPSKSPRRKLKPLRSDLPPPSPSQRSRVAKLNEAAEALLGGGSGPPPEPDNPFSKGSGLPPPQDGVVSLEEEFDDRKVTEVIRYDQIK